MITHKTTKGLLKIYINNKLHLVILLASWVSCQSWIDPSVEAPYKIEYYLRGTSVLTEYDTIDKWLAILDILDTIEPIRY